MEIVEILEAKLADADEQFAALARSVARGETVDPDQALAVLRLTSRTPQELEAEVAKQQEIIRLRSVIAQNKDTALDEEQRTAERARNEQVRAEGNERSEMDRRHGQTRSEWVELQQSWKDATNAVQNATRRLAALGVEVEDTT